jgi:hypothetical protein
MGRSQGRKIKVIDARMSSNPSLIRGRAVVEGFELIDQTKLVKDVGSDSHRRRLEAYLRTRVKDGVLSFNGQCESCGGLLPDYAGPDEKTCRCDEYIPNGISCTDLDGNIQVQIDAPPEGTVEEREVCMRGFLDHEICHEVWTSTEAAKAFFKDLKKLSQNQEERKASQLKWIQNVLEDGMIEEREREFNSENFRFISACNYLWPRTGKESWKVNQDQYAPLPDGYIPVDADGNDLQVVDGKVFIPAGTELTLWGEKPLDPAQQARVALMTMCFPEHKTGELNPKVAKALEECAPHIDAAVSGNTSDCIARSYEVQRILRDHGLLQDEMTPEERQQLEQAMKNAQVSMVSISGDGGGGQMEQDLENGGGPTMEGSGGSGGGGVPQPMNGVPDESGMSDELKDKMENGSGVGDKGDQTDQQQGGGSGDGDPSGSDSSGGNGSGDFEDPNAKNNAQAGGGIKNNSADKNKPLPKETREKNEAEGKGKASQEDVEKMKKDAKQDLANDKVKEKSKASQAKRGGKGSDKWSMPDRNSLRGQKELSKHKGAAKDYVNTNDEKDVASHGRKLGRRLERLRTQASKRKRKQRRGRLDQRRLASSQAGEQRVFEKRGKDLDLDMEIDVSIDLSGSTSSERPNIYKMSKMFAVAGREAKVPTGIYGWQGSKGSGVYHYALKEKSSDNLGSLDAIFKAEGGLTPTSEGIAFARARFAQSKASIKLLPVITDGIANAGSNPAEQIKKARKEGITVIGFGFGDGCDPDKMDEYFGKGQWVPIKDYGEASSLVAGIIERQARKQLARS